jgi:hypothetical protein
MGSRGYELPTASTVSAPDGALHDRRIGLFVPDNPIELIEVMTRAVLTDLHWRPQAALHEISPSRCDKGRRAEARPVSHARGNHRDASVTREHKLPCAGPAPPRRRLLRYLGRTAPSERGDGHGSGSASFTSQLRSMVSYTPRRWHERVSPETEGPDPGWRDTHAACANHQHDSRLVLLAVNSCSAIRLPLGAAKRSR